MQSRINLINIYDIEQRSPYRKDVLHLRNIVNYCEARFCAALHAIARARPENKKWMTLLLHDEMVWMLVEPSCTLIHDHHLDVFNV